MELLIMRLGDAVEYEPVNKTYAIRIFSEYALDHLFDLKKSERWVNIAGYCFDDVWPGFPGLERKHILFDDDLAQKVLTEFDALRGETDTLLVHCARGRNRSPAVGIALNEIFGLGHDTEVLKEKYDEANWYVYEKMLEVAGTIGL